MLSTYTFSWRKLLSEAEVVNSPEVRGRFIQRRSGFLNASTSQTLFASIMALLLDASEIMVKSIIPELLLGAARHPLHQPSP